MRLLLPGVWLMAGLLAGALPYARTATALRRGALLTMVALVAGIAASLAFATPALTTLAAVAVGMAAPRPATKPRHRRRSAPPPRTRWWRHRYRPRRTRPRFSPG